MSKVKITVGILALIIVIAIGYIISLSLPEKKKTGREAALEKEQTAATTEVSQAATEEVSVEPETTEPTKEETTNTEETTPATETSTTTETTETETAAKGTTLLSTQLWANNYLVTVFDNVYEMPAESIVYLNETDHQIFIQGSFLPAEHTSIHVDDIIVLPGWESPNTITGYRITGGSHSDESGIYQLTYKEANADLIVADAESDVTMPDGYGYTAKAATSFGTWSKNQAAVGGYLIYLKDEVILIQQNENSYFADDKINFFREDLLSTETTVGSDTVILVTEPANEDNAISISSIKAYKLPKVSADVTEKGTLITCEKPEKVSASSYYTGYIQLADGLAIGGGNDAEIAKAQAEIEILREKILALGGTTDDITEASSTAEQAASDPEAAAEITEAAAESFTQGSPITMKITGPDTTTAVKVDINKEHYNPVMSSDVQGSVQLRSGETITFFIDNYVAETWDGPFSWYSPQTTYKGYEICEYQMDGKYHYLLRDGNHTHVMRFDSPVQLSLTDIVVL
jgi:hypothetical protein